MFCNSHKLDSKDARDSSSDSTIREINRIARESVYSCFTRRSKMARDDIASARAGVSQETESDEDESC